VYYTKPGWVWYAITLSVHSCRAVESNQNWIVFCYWTEYLCSNWIKLYLSRRMAGGQLCSQRIHIFHHSVTDPLPPPQVRFKGGRRHRAATHLSKYSKLNRRTFSIFDRIWFDFEKKNNLNKKYLKLQQKKTKNSQNIILTGTVRYICPYRPQCFWKFAIFMMADFISWLMLIQFRIELNRFLNWINIASNQKVSAMLQLLDPKSNGIETDLIGNKPCVTLLWLVCTCYQMRRRQCWILLIRGEYNSTGSTYHLIR
jgi:hypothetical protein